MPSVTTAVCQLMDQQQEMHCYHLNRNLMEQNFIQLSSYSQFFLFVTVGLWGGRILVLLSGWLLHPLPHLFYFLTHTSLQILIAITFFPPREVTVLIPGVWFSGSYTGRHWCQQRWSQSSQTSSAMGPMLTFSTWYQGSVFSAVFLAVSQILDQFPAITLYNLLLPSIKNK